jgi:type I restriction enzyme S subunit
MDRAPRDGDGVITAFRDGDVTLRENRRTEGFTESVSQSNYQRIHEGDLVIHSMDAFAGAIGVSDSTGQASPVYVVCQPFDPEEVDVHFYKYLLRHMASSGYIESLAKGIRERSSDFRYSEFANQYLPVPPLSEQRAIVNHLEDTLDDIDNYIARKRALVDLLETQRRAVVNRAVTTGLDDDVAMQDSGVEWLGEIPAHWETRRMKYCIKDGSSISYGIVQPGDHTRGGVPFLQTSNITGGSLDTSDLQRTKKEIADSYPRSRLEAGDVILGIRASIGAAHVVPDKLQGANLSRGIARIVPKGEINQHYLTWYLRTSGVHRYWDLSNQGSTFQEVSIRKVRELPVVVPPPEEQKRIVEHIDTQTADIDAAIERTERQIELMQQYRTSLVTEVVTGAVDVRAEVAA